MNKIEINEEFFEKPFLSYDASVILFDSIRERDSEMNDEEKEVLYDIIEGSTGNFIKYLNNWSQHPDFFSSSLYKHIYTIFSILLHQGSLSKRDIFNISKLSNISFPPPKIDSEITNKIKEKVLSHVNLYLDDDNEGKENLINKAVCYNLIGEQDKSFHTLVTPIDKAPDSPDSYEDVIGYLLGYGRYDEAIPYLEKVIKLEPSNIIYYQELIGIYMDKSDYSNIIRLCIQYDVENKGESPLYLILGDAYLSSGRFEEAIITYASSSVDEYSVAKLRKIGDFLYNKNEFDLSEMAYEEIIKVSPDYYYPYNQIGCIYFARENYVEASEFLGKALLCEDKKANVYANLGFTYRYLGKYPAAINFLKTGALLANNNQERKKYNEFIKYCEFLYDNQKAIEGRQNKKDLEF